MCIQLVAALEDCPAHTLVTFIQEALKTPQDIVSVCDTAIPCRPDYILHAVQQELLGKNDICTVGHPECTVAARADARKTLISRDHPGIHWSGRGCLPILFEQRRTRRRLKAEVIHALPVT